MERPSCVGCLFSSSTLIVFFTSLIIVILNRIFKIGIFQEFSFVSFGSFFDLFMAHKTLVAISVILALLPTFYVAAVINDLYVRYKRIREKEMEATIQAYKADKEEKFHLRTLPKADTDDIDPSRFKPPSRSLPKNTKED